MRASATTAATSKTSKAFAATRSLLQSCRGNKHTVKVHASAATEGPLLVSSSRRNMLATVAGAAAVSSLASLQLCSAGPAAAAAAPECDFVSSPSGLQFCDIKVGDGPEPVKGALIRCHYTGRLASNNRVFDSSYERGRPLTFKVGVHEVISGWDLGILGTEGIPAMKEGGKRVLLIPSELGYGARGAGGVIPPNADLLFEVELLGKRR